MSSEQMEVSVFGWIGEKSLKGETLITKEKIVNHFGIPRGVFKEYIDNEASETEACCTLPFTLLLVISYAFVAVLHDNAPIIRAVEDSLQFDIYENANFAFVQFNGSPNMGHKGVVDVNSVADLWSWARWGLLPLIFNSEYLFHEEYNVSDPRYINASKRVLVNDWLNYNRIIGGARWSQERSGENPQKPCSTLKELLPFYNQQCVHGFGYELYPEMRLARFSTKPEKIQWMYTYENMSTLVAKVWQMDAADWVDRNTKKVEIAIPSYNSEFGVHTLIYINFFVNRGGHIWKRVIPLSTYAQWHPKWYYWFVDVVWLLCVSYIFVTELIEISIVVRRSGGAGILKEYMGFWNAFDWISVFCAFAVIVMFFFAIDFSMKVNDGMSRVPGYGTVPLAVYTLSISEHVLQLEAAVQYGHWFRIALAAYPIIIVGRLFKAYKAQPRLALVTNTLKNASTDLLHFLIVFLSVFLSFVVSGCALFGREVEDFGTFDRAMLACFRLLFGDIQWDDMRQIGVAEAMIWLWLFVIIVMMLLLNMLLAIVMDHYVACKRAAAKRETLWDQGMKSYRRWRACRRGQQVSIDKIVDAFKREQIAREQEEDDEEMDAAPGEIKASMDEEIIDLDAIRTTYKNFLRAELPINQARELMLGAVAMFYERHRGSVDMDEVLWLTRKVEYRTKKIMKLCKKHHESNSKLNEIQKMRDFVRELTIFIEELRDEREAHQREIDELRSVKHGLLLQLQTRLPELDIGQLGGGPSSETEESYDRTKGPAVPLSPTSGGFLDPENEQVDEEDVRAQMRGRFRAASARLHGNAI